jgi:hypothetical protein
LNRGTLRHAFRTHESEGITKYCHVRTSNINAVLTFCVKAVGNHCWPAPSYSTVKRVYFSNLSEEVLVNSALRWEHVLKSIRVHVCCIYLIQDRIWERAFVNTVTNT